MVDVKLVKDNGVERTLEGCKLAFVIGFGKTEDVGKVQTAVMGEQAFGGSTLALVLSKSIVEAIDLIADSDAEAERMLMIFQANVQEQCKERILKRLKA